MVYSGTFQPLNDDEYAPKTSKLTHQHIDNYGIYSIVCLDYSVSSQGTIDSYFFASPFRSFDYSSAATNQTEIDLHHGVKLVDLLAYQRFDPNGIDIDFEELVNIGTPSSNDIKVLGGINLSLNTFNVDFPANFRRIVNPSSIGFGARLTVDFKHQSSYFFNGNQFVRGGWSKSVWIPSLGRIPRSVICNRLREMLVPPENWNGNDLADYPPGGWYFLGFFAPANPENKAAIASAIDTIGNTKITELDVSVNLPNWDNLTRDEQTVFVTQPPSSLGTIHDTATLSIGWGSVRLNSGGQTATSYLSPATYLDLVSGYVLDTRVKPTELIIKNNNSKNKKKLKVSFYRHNNLEQYAKAYPEKQGVSFIYDPNVNPTSFLTFLRKRNLTTIDWFSTSIEIEPNKQVKVSLEGIVLGTLVYNDTQDLEITTNGTNSTYQLNHLRYNLTGTINLFTEWRTLFDSFVASKMGVIITKSRITSQAFYREIEPYQVYETYSSQTNPVVPFLTNSTAIILNLTPRITRRINHAFNNPWSNKEPLQDENFEATHPLFDFNDDSFDKDGLLASIASGQVNGTFLQYFEPQLDGSRGKLIMDSPRIIEIHAALDAVKYSKDPQNPTTPRVSNLGWYLERVAQVLGIRVKPDGKVDRDQEKALYMASTLVSPKYDKDLYGMNAWGERGLVIPHLPTSYNSSGRLEKRYDVVHDYAQLLQAILAQIDESLSIQNGSEIRTKNIDGEIVGYPNQLALLLDLHQQLQRVNDRAEDTYRIALVSGAEIRELFGGIGIPVTQKFLPPIPANKDFKSKGQNLLYFAYQKSKPSILSHLSTLSINVGIILGTLMPKRVESARLNPFQFFKKKD